mmetsp:Transcript_15333/g.40600  ORF Transcript_15333/g.40600 Transcript_15333/m.40600 type:complete len:211 (-) Transcript_15333:214-846(-)
MWIHACPQGKTKSNNCANVNTFMSLWRARKNATMPLQHEGRCGEDGEKKRGKDPRRRKKDEGPSPDYHTWAEMRELKSWSSTCTAWRSTALAGLFSREAPSTSSWQESWPSPSVSSMANTLSMSDRSKPMALSHSSTCLLLSTFLSSSWSTSPLPSLSAFWKNSVSLALCAFAALLTSFNIMLSSRAATLNVSLRKTPEITSITANPKTS